ncbi:hypothetical protein [Streptomyces sp. NPDC093094]
MLETLAQVPAFVLGRRTDVLASNRLARTVLTDFDALPAGRRNLARYYLLDPDARERVGDWEQIAAETVAVLRLEAGRHPHDRQLADLVGELTLKSTEFTSWWNDHRVLRRTHGAKRCFHPLVGELRFSYESFQVRATRNRRCASTTSSRGPRPPTPSGSWPAGPHPGSPRPAPRTPADTARPVPGPQARAVSAGRAAGPSGSPSQSQEPR